jgi:hypothetical protein
MARDKDAISSRKRKKMGDEKRTTTRGGTRAGSIRDSPSSYLCSWPAI